MFIDFVNVFTHSVHLTGGDMRLSYTFLIEINTYIKFSHVMYNENEFSNNQLGLGSGLRVRVKGNVKV